MTTSPRTTYLLSLSHTQVDYSQANWADDYYRKKMGIEPMDHVSIERVCQESVLPPLAT